MMTKFGLIAIIFTFLPLLSVAVEQHSSLKVRTTATDLVRRLNLVRSIIDKIGALESKIQYTQLSSEDKKALNGYLEGLREYQHKLFNAYDQVISGDNIEAKKLEAEAYSAALLPFRRFAAQFRYNEEEAVQRLFIAGKLVHELEMQAARNPRQFIDERLYIDLDYLRRALVNANRYRNTWNRNIDILTSIWEDGVSEAVAEKKGRFDKDFHYVWSPARAQELSDFLKTLSGDDRKRIVAYTEQDLFPGLTTEILENLPIAIDNELKKYR